jgi:hypothetical protein
MRLSSYWLFNTTLPCCSKQWPVCRFIFLKKTRDFTLESKYNIKKDLAVVKLEVYCYNRPAVSGDEETQIT